MATEMPGPHSNFTDIVSIDVDRLGIGGAEHREARLVAPDEMTLRAFTTSKGYE